MTKISNKLVYKLSTLEKILLISGSDAVCFIASIIFVSTLYFFIKVPVNIINLIIAVSITLVFHFWFSFKLRADIMSQTIALTITTIVFSISLLAAFLVIDTSYDGQSYHQEAIILLDYGWNPIYMRLTNEATANLERWLNHYPKANWIVAANLYKLTGSIESGKVLSIFSGIIAFIFVLLGIARTKFNIFMKIIISLLIALNPVFLYQSLSYYIDGVLVSLLLALAFISARYVSHKEKFLFWPFLFTTIILINIKLIAAAYFAAQSVLFLAYLWFNDRLRMSIWFGKTIFVSTLIGAAIIGFNPYITNFVSNGHPLYPAMGKGAYDYVSTNTPQNYWNLVPPLRLIASIFSKSSLERGENRYGQLKQPFEITKPELESFRETNAKVGGFGPLFALAIIVSAIGYIYLILDRAPSFRTKLIYTLALLLIAGFASAVPTSSVARYVPFFWWLPCLIALFLFTNRNNLSNLFAFLIILILFINNSLIAGSYYPYNIKQSQTLNRQLVSLSSQVSSPAIIYFGQYGSTKVKLDKHNIPFKEVYTDAECKKGTRFLVNNISKLCEPLINN